VRTRFSEPQFTGREGAAGGGTTGWLLTYAPSGLEETFSDSLLGFCPNQFASKPHRGFEIDRNIERSMSVEEALTALTELVRSEFAESAERPRADSVLLPA
jgi:hypothetical protein